MLEQLQPTTPVRVKKQRRLPEKEVNSSPEREYSENSSDSEEVEVSNQYAEHTYEYETDDFREKGSVFSPTAGNKNEDLSKDGFNEMLKTINVCDSNEGTDLEINEIWAQIWAQMSSFPRSN